jgi:spermidine synthase
VALVALLLWGKPFWLRHTKTYAETEPQTTPIYERWTPTARLTVFDHILFARRKTGFGWGVGERAAPVSPPAQYWLEQDGSAGSPLTRFDGDLARVSYLWHDVTTVGYQLRPPATVAIVGAGGGRDILVALLAGATHIDAIELNAGIVDALRGPFADFAGRIYDRPGVVARIGEGRSVLTRSNRTYDLIQISLTDSWAATAAGGYTLAENSLYTLEAYRLYYSRLSPQGMVSTTRWMLGGFGLEVPRLLLLVKAALEAEGVSSPLDHIAMLQGDAVGTVLMSRAPLNPDELSRLRSIAFVHGFTLHLPVTDLPPEQQWMRKVVEVGPVLYQRFGLRMDPPTDDRPFFFQVLSPFQPIRADVALHAGKNAEGVGALQQLMLLLTGLSLVLFFAPFPLARWLRPEPGLWRGSVFFAGIGLSFMFLEMAWLQRFILYLGHPSLATTVTLGWLLLGAGLGSMSSPRLGLARGQRLVMLAPLVLLLTNAALGPAFDLTLGWPWAARVALAAAALVPAGLVMGLFFPLGMVRFGEGNRAWLWAVNGAAGVLAGAVSLALSMHFGVSSVAYLGGAVYLGAALALWGRPQARGSGAAAVATSKT